MMRICAWGDRRYASHYLIPAINSAAAEMTYDGSMSVLMTVERYTTTLKNRNSSCTGHIVPVLMRFLA
jgi:hypothetical protein